METLFGYLVIAFVVMVVFSPAWWFLSVERVIRNDSEYGSDKNLSANYIPTHIIIHDVSNTEDMIADETMVARLQQTLDSAPNAEMRRIWGNKLASVKRDIRWNTLAQFAGASQRGGTT
jgi:hypothetical protein